MNLSIEAAAQRLAGRVARTPLLESDRLNAMAGTRVLLKAENLQCTGSFKFRGALHAMLSLDEAQLARGVVAFSSGNHALAVAQAAACLGTAAVVVMPHDAPAAKREGARRAGAEVVSYERGRDDREAICARLCEQRGLSLIPPYDDERVIAGQGTVALEAVAQAREFGATVGAMLVPCSGGGLAAGCALALSQAAPGARVIACEPEGFDDMARSLRAREPVSNPSASGSICDALLVTTPGKLTFPILQRCDAGGVAVSDDEVMDALRFALRELRLVLEPGGAAALAAAMFGRRYDACSAVVAVLSGGNVRAEVLASAAAVMLHEEAKDA